MSLPIKTTGNGWAEWVCCGGHSDEPHREGCAGEALEECISALYGVKEILGSIGNIQHAIDLGEKAIKKMEDPQTP